MNLMIVDTISLEYLLLIGHLQELNKFVEDLSNIPVEELLGDLSRF